MQDFELAKRFAERAFEDLWNIVEGVDEPRSWAKIECLPGEYLHSEGTILSLVMHIASCKRIYASCAFRDMEFRWRDAVEDLSRIWPNWSVAKSYLRDSHEYWMQSWAGESDLERLVTRFNGVQWPSWRIIETVTHHDQYHAGQIELVKSIAKPSEVPPPNEADLWEKYCGELPSW